MGGGFAVSVSLLLFHSVRLAIEETFHALDGSSNIETVRRIAKRKASLWFSSCINAEIEVIVFVDDVQTMPSD